MSFDKPEPHQPVCFRRQGKPAGDELGGHDATDIDLAFPTDRVLTFERGRFPAVGETGSRDQHGSSGVRDDRDAQNTIIVMKRAVGQGAGFLGRRNVSDFDQLLATGIFFRGWRELPKA